MQTLCKHKRAKLVHAWGAFSTSMAPKLVTDAVTAPTDLLTLHGCSENAFAASDSLLSYTPHYLLRFPWIDFGLIFLNWRRYG